MSGSAKFNIVFFDLETTGLYNSNPEIVQIGAVTFDGDDSFDTYLLPNKAIQAKASEVNNLYTDMAEKRLVRLITTTSMPAVFRQCYTNQQKGGLLKFINWLKDDVGGNVILVAYNGFKFDGRILLKKISEQKLSTAFDSVVVGFIDPLEASKEHFTHLTSRSMEFMMKELKVSTDQSHNALLDAIHLRDLTFAIQKRVTENRGDISWFDFYRRYFKMRPEVAADI